MRTAVACVSVIVSVLHGLLFWPSRPEGLGWHRPDQLLYRVKVQGSAESKHRPYLRLAPAMFDLVDRAGRQLSSLAQVTEWRLPPKRLESLADLCTFARGEFGLSR